MASSSVPRTRGTHSSQARGSDPYSSTELKRHLPELAGTYAAAGAVVQWAAEGEAEVQARSVAAVAAAEGAEAAIWAVAWGAPSEVPVDLPVGLAEAEGWPFQRSLREEMVEGTVEVRQSGARAASLEEREETEVLAVEQGVWAVDGAEQVEATQSAHHPSWSRCHNRPHRYSRRRCCTPADTCRPASSSIRTPQGTAAHWQIESSV